MDTLIEIAVFLVCGGVGVLLSRLFITKTTSKENQQVVVKVDQITKENDSLLKDAENNLNEAQKIVDALEKEKNKDVSNKEIEDFFKNRKDIQ